MGFRKSNTSDSFIEIEGRRKTILYNFYNFFCIITFGILYIICKNFPRVRIVLTTKQCDLKSADKAVITNKFKKHELVDILVYKCTKSQLMSRFVFNGYVRVIDTVYARLIYDVGFEKFVVYSYKQTNFNFDEIFMNKIKISEHEEKIQLREKGILYGKNFNNLRFPSIVEIFIKNTFNFTNLIDIFCVVLWFNIEYKIYGSIVALFRLYSYAQDIILEIKVKHELETAKKNIKIRTYRNRSFCYIDSVDLLPGDLVYIEPCEDFPVDVIILKGDAITDESFLTGESVPICKSAAYRSIVYSGTAVLRSVDESKWLPNKKIESLYRVKNLTNKGGLNVKSLKNLDRNDFLNLEKSRKSNLVEDISKNTFVSKNSSCNFALGIVIAIGFNTTRGKIMKDINNPKPVYIPFLNEAHKYIFFTIIIAGISVVFFLIYFDKILKWDLIDNLVYSADLFFTLASPALYASLSVGVQISSKRLRDDKIKCNNSDRLFISGNVDMAIFDKTGTLTSEGMDFLFFDNLYSKSYNADQLDPLSRIGFSSCHSVYELDGKYSGDALDIQMFIVSESKLEMGGNGQNDSIRKIIIGKSAGISGPFLKEFGVDSDKLFYQNVTNLETSYNDVMARGFGKNIINILKTYDFTSENKRMSVIIEHQNKKYFYTKGSPDIIKLLLKKIPDDYDNRVKEHSLSGYRVIAMGYKELKNIDKEENNESELNFLGFIVFSNKLKPETYEVIEELNSANIHSIICTGDNILTAISVGRECKILDESITVIFPVLNENCKSVYDAEWVCLGDEDLVFDKVRLILYKNNFDTYCNDFVIACEGKEYDFFKDTIYHSFILEKGKVFARFSPAQKKVLVEDFRSINKNVLFCGDGANDSGAIGTADVGIALAQNEASLASSFCARNINAVPLIIKECRNAYVSSIALFKYVSMSYFLAFVCLGFPVLRCLFLSDFQTLHIDIFIIVPMMFFISNFKKNNILYKKSPKISLFSLTEFLPFFCSLFFQSLIIFILSRYGPESKQITEESKAGTIIFFTAAFQSIFNGLYFSDAVPHRESILKNKNILYISSLFMIWNSLLLFINWFNHDFTSRFLSVYLFVEISNSELLLIILGILGSSFSSFLVPYYVRKFLNRNLQ